jgi:hypothetical protein
VPRRLVLERDGDSLEGIAAGRLVDRRSLLGRGPFFASGRDHAERVLWFVGCLFASYYFSRGVFPQLLGDPYVCP